MWSQLMILRHIKWRVNFTLFPGALREMPEGTNNNACRGRSCLRILFMQFIYNFSFLKK
ncbi:hypothetical protein SDJN02_07720, partial [Cucurbita argyrosperma subsp. argyrosperma]